MTFEGWLMIGALGGLVFAVALCAFLLWVTIAEMWSFWKARNVRRMW